MTRDVPYAPSTDLIILIGVAMFSIGEDSKTLMLVHVSPNENDLGETICSLSFATRVRGTHLGHELSAVVHSTLSDFIRHFSRSPSNHSRY
jgi:hypothetical protein